MNYLGNTNLDFIIFLYLFINSVSYFIVIEKFIFLFILCFVVISIILVPSFIQNRFINYLIYFGVYYFSIRFLNYHLLSFFHFLVTTHFIEFYYYSYHIIILMKCFSFLTFMN